MANNYQKVDLGAETKPGLVPKPGAGTSLGKNGPSLNANKPTPDAGLNPVVLPEITHTVQNAVVQAPGKNAIAEGSEAVPFDKVTVLPENTQPSNVKTPGTTDPTAPAVAPPAVVLPVTPAGGSDDKPETPAGGSDDKPVTPAGKPEDKPVAPAQPAQNTQTPLPQVTLPQATWTTVQAPTLTAPQMPDVPSADIAAMRAQLEDWQAIVNAQNANRVNYGVNQAVTELQRAEQDAQAQFKEQVESVALDERQGMDNSALYAEARGDKGGIGQAQYNAIQAAAAQNRLAVQQQQTKLSTDTARQIADLRAKGEFEKADAMLETAQTYLTQLTQLEQWAANYGLDAAQFKATLAQWQAEYDMAMAKYKTDVDMYNSEMGYKAGRDQVSDSKWNAEMQFKQEQADIGNAQWQQSFDAEQKQNSISNQLKAQSQLASMGEALLDAGVMPSKEQLSAMGLTTEQAQEWVIAAQLKAAQSSVGGSTDAGNGGAPTFNTTAELYKALQDAGATTKSGAAAQLEMWGYDSGKFVNDYISWVESQPKDSKDGHNAVVQEMYDVMESLRASGATKEKMFETLDGFGLSPDDMLSLAWLYGLL